MQLDTRQSSKQRSSTASLSSRHWENLSKLKPDGTLKHRIIQDLRRGGANLLAAMFERIVLPRPSDHGWDLYSLWKKLAKGELPRDSSIWSLIVDFEGAFMSTGTCPGEQRFTAAKVQDASAPTGSYVCVWRTLGFGGKTFPFVYARPAFFAARTAQALMDPERAKLQLYVDDLALALVGSRECAFVEGSIPILCWLVLGLGHSWLKGSLTEAKQTGHDWIGVRYALGPDGPTMELPHAYLADTLHLLTPLCATRGTIAESSGCSHHWAKPPGSVMSPRMRLRT